MIQDVKSTRVEVFLKNLDFARGYTKTLLNDLNEGQWFWTPSSINHKLVTTHIAWQVGHLAMAQYGLCLFRQRGRQSVDTELMSSRFRKLFMKGTTASTDFESHPKPDDIIEVLDRVYDQVLVEVPTFSDESLNEAVGPPTAAYETKFGCLLMAVNHEMLHAGQIGLLRRLMGLDPIR